MGKISKYFLNGVIVLVPIAITLFILNHVLGFAEWVVGRFLPNGMHFPGVALIVTLAGVILIGRISTHWAMQRLLAWSEKLLNRIPGVKFIYNSVKQLSSAMLESKSLFKQPVLVPFPYAGSHALGFVTSDVADCLAKHLPEDPVCVFIPMSLNMTAGFNILVSAKDVVPLDVTGESALQYVLTAGAIMPKSTAENN